MNITLSKLPTFLAYPVDKCKMNTFSTLVPEITSTDEEFFKCAILDSQFEFFKNFPILTLIGWLFWFFLSVVPGVVEFATLYGTSVSTQLINILIHAFEVYSCLFLLPFLKLCINYLSFMISWYIAYIVKNWNCGINTWFCSWQRWQRYASR